MKISNFGIQICNHGFHLNNIINNILNFNNMNINMMNEKLNLIEPMNQNQFLQNFNNCQKNNNIISNEIRIFTKRFQNLGNGYLKTIHASSEITIEELLNLFFKETELKHLNKNNVKFYFNGKTIGHQQN